MSSAVHINDNITLYHGDCLEVMLEMESNSVNLIATDPPYFKVKGEAWDRQWDDKGKFVEWIGTLCEQWQRLLVANGSLYCFASPKMSASVEVKIGEWFNVLNRITWPKDAGWAKRQCKEEQRAFFPASESIIFAEHFSADNIAKGETGYAAKCDELRGFVFEPLRKYICDEFERAGMLNTDGKIKANVACGFSASSGGMASRHYFSKSQWCLPTEDHYAAMRKLLNSSNCKTDYLRREYEDLRREYEDLRREYEDLRREYEDLRREYEDLRREYEDLRRPFSVSKDVPYTDVWSFPTVQSYKGKHPCEKPLPMMEHIATASSREDQVVFDPFMGSGTTGVACVRTGRKFIGIEKEEKYFDIACKRIEQELNVLC